MRPFGEITDDVEPLLQEMLFDHKMQAHEIIGYIRQYIQTHCDEQIEEYDDGTIPVLYYGHKDGLK